MAQNSLNQAFLTVGLDLLPFLDNQTLCQCRLVCQNWAKFIDSTLFWWARIVQGCQNKLGLEWNLILKQICAERNSAKDVRILGAILQDFFATFHRASGLETLLTPYYVAVWNGNLGHVLFLWAFVKDKNPKIGRYEDSLIHAVAERGHVSIFKLLLNEVANKNPKGKFFFDVFFIFGEIFGNSSKIGFVFHFLA